MAIPFNLRITGYFILFLLSNLNSQTSKRWSLQECIEYAILNNYQLAQNNLQVDRSKFTLRQSQAQIFPSINGSANHTYNTGRRIDPFTNQFAQSRVLSENFSLSGNINLFSGLSNTNTLLANQLSIKASEFSNDQFKNDISLQVANAFLQILLADELLTIAENQLRLIKEQTERGKILFESGRTARGDYLQLEGQQANEELNVINAGNRVNLAKLTLAQLLALENADGFDISKPDFSQLKIEMPPYNAHDVLVVALENQPGIKSAEYSLLSAERILKATKGSYYPSLSLFGGLGTGYSQLAKKVIGTQTQQQNFGSINGQPIIVDVEVPIYERTPFSDQWSGNFNKTFGFSLNVPLFSGLRARTQVSFQKITIENARLQTLITKNQLRRDIQSAFFDCKSAFERFNATAKTVTALNESFEYMKQRYDVGLVTTFEFNSTKNQLTVAQSNLAQARYEFILREKVLAFYQGKPISF
jgi:outer membrane protein